MYLKSWDDFQSAAESLYAKSPDKARYCVKWKSSAGELVLKITDDVTCIKYKTKSSIVLNRFDALTLSLMSKMQNTKLPELIPTVAPGARASTPLPAQSATVAAAASSATQDGSNAGVSKKKPKKKKK